MLLWSALALMLGCSHPDPLCVETVDARLGDLTVSAREGASCDKPVRLSSVEVRQEDGTLMWSMRVPSGKEVEVRDLHYAVLVDGASGIDAKPLEPGMKLKFKVKGITGAVGVAKVTVQKR